MYRVLWRIRLFETQVQRLAAAGEVPGFPHLSTGQEAVAVGVCEHLTRKDVLFTSHRGHGHTLAKGSDMRAVFAEIIGRDSGLCRGRGGSMHLVDAANGMLGATGVVGGNLPLAAGAAWAAQIASAAKGDTTISVAFFGDGATGAAGMVPSPPFTTGGRSSRPRTDFKVSAMPGTVTVLPWNWRVDGPTSVNRKGMTFTASGPRLAPGSLPARWRATSRFSTRV